MAELKTKKTQLNVSDFISKIDDETKRDDAKIILDMMKEVSGSEPKIWGDSIIGFGDIRYKYSTGREADWFRIGFSPRKANISLYLMSGLSGLDEHLAKLGKHKLGKGCLYIKKLSDIDIEVLKQIFIISLESLEKNNAILCGC